MKIKMLQTAAFSDGILFADQVYDIENNIAIAFIRSGYAKTECIREIALLNTEETATLPTAKSKKRGR